MRNNKYRTLWQILVLFTVSFIVLLIDWWQTGSWRIPAIVIVCLVVVSAILYLYFRKYWPKILTKFRSEKSQLGTSVRLFGAGILALLFALYVLIPNPQVALPAGLQFNVIIISATLGGLVLAGASNHRITDETHDRLMSVAQKLIASTLLFLIFTVFLFWVDFAGGINVNAFDLSGEGIMRGILFYSGAISFYVGIFLFSLSLIDLALTLGQIRKKPWGGIYDD